MTTHLRHEAATEAVATGRSSRSSARATTSTTARADERHESIVYPVDRVVVTRTSGRHLTG